MWVILRAKSFAGRRAEEGRGHALMQAPKAIDAEATYHKVLWTEKAGDVEQWLHVCGLDDTNDALEGNTYFSSGTRRQEGTRAKGEG